MNFTLVQGQSCGSNSRVFVHRDVHEPLMERVIQLVSKIRMGLPEREETQMGPVITREHHCRVLEYIESGKADGARLDYGGGRPADPGFSVVTPGSAEIMMCPVSVWFPVAQTMPSACP